MRDLSGSRFVPLWRHFPRWVQSEKRVLTVDGFVHCVSLKEMGNMNGDNFEQYFTSGQRFCLFTRGLVYNQNVLQEV